MSPIDHEAKTIGARPSSAHTVAASTAAPSTGKPHVVQDTQPLDTATERYTTQRLLGEGGMGEVHLCRDGRIERSVAMKVARGGANIVDEARARFIHEARIQGQLEHPAIVPVYDLGVRPDGSVYFTMKRVRGRTLAEVIRLLSEGDAKSVQHYTRRRLLAAFSSVCMAVHFAHTRGVLHRDLKPSNVMLGDFGEVYVLDWGLAKVIGEPERPTRDADAQAEEETARARITGNSGTGYTIDGAMLGTPGFMSPEQTLGRLEELDARTDVYALGSILFEMLALKPLHEGASLGHIVRSTIEGADARPSLRAPNADIPPELDALCVKATATLREDRYATVGELAEAIEKFLDGDRDLERRRQISREHAAAATVAAKRAAAGGAEAEKDHAEAMREVGRAIVMDPGNVDAMRTLVDLLSHTPAVLPPAARETLNADRRAMQREGGLLGGFAYTSWILYMPLAFWMGIRNLPLGILIVSIGLATGIISFWLAKHPTHDARIPYALLIGAFSSVAGFSLAFGPYILISGMAAVNAIAFILGAGRLRRNTTVLLACLAFVVPAVLEWTGVWPRSLAYTAQGIAIIPRFLQFTRPATEIFLVVANLAFVVTTSILVSRFRDAMSAAEEKLHFHAWQLRQLVPSGEK